MKLWRYVAVATVTALVAACSSTGGSTSGGGGGGENELDPNATFRFADTLPIDTLDPHTSPGAGNNVWLFPVYDRLIHLSPDAELVPGLATNWEFTDDGTTLALTLREGVTFSDDTPFDAEAVKANIERAQTVEGSAVKGELAVIESVEVVDDYQVEFNLANVNSSLPYVLTGRAGAMASPEAFDSLAQEPVGSGMYTVASYQPGTSATYERNEDYWDPEAAQAATMEFTTVTDSLQRLNALKTGSIDATILSAKDVEAAKSADFTVASEPVLEFYHLQLNISRPYLDDVRVRKAINHAIDRESLVSGLLFGLGAPAVQPFPQDYFAYDEEIGTDHYAYDPERARELLAEAEVPEGQTIELINQNAPSYTQLSEAIKSQLAEVGLNAEITQTTNFANSFYVEGNGDAGAINWTGRPDPAQTAGLLYTEEGFANPAKETTSEVADLHQELVATIDDDEREQLARDLSAQITEDALDVVLYFPFQNVAYSDKVQGLEPWLSGKLEFRGVGMTQ
ncbi:ABC transporter substrate-binding protein [Salinactinospora qingdaonensis]|uniref:ABC transporter substrate-binding protein n=1 Tax=Salinactinospora qingdaonensis TaxID=702744 RepID=A0ABP7F5H4_9ACTN